MQQVALAGPRDYNRWGILALVCRDLTGDGRADMAVVFACCTSGALTPLLIFLPHGGHWQLSFGAMSPLIWALHAHGRELIEHRPVFSGNVPLCCPSAYHDWSVRYTRHGWKFHRVR